MIRDVFGHSRLSRLGGSVGIVKDEGLGSSASLLSKFLYREMARCKLVLEVPPVTDWRYFKISMYSYVGDIIR